MLQIVSDEKLPGSGAGRIPRRLRLADIVLAIGNPFGVGQTVTQGIVSALARTQVGISDYQFFIQTDAAINPGNSGGALLDMNGRVVGINTAIYSRSGGSHGIGFAIPAAMVHAVVESARIGADRVRRPWLGASVQEVTPDIAESVGLARPSGVLVTHVLDDSPADRAGLRRGDIIRAVEGAPDQRSGCFRLSLRPRGPSRDWRASISCAGERALDLDIPLDATAGRTAPRDADHCQPHAFGRRHRDEPLPRRRRGIAGPTGPRRRHRHRSRSALLRRDLRISPGAISFWR